MSDRKSFCSFPANFKRQLIKSLKCRQKQRGLNIWGEEEGVGGVLGLICFLPNSSPTNLALSVNYRVGGIYASHYQTLWGILIAVQLLPVCASPPLSFSNVPLHSPNLLYLYFPVYLYLHLYLYICGSPPLSFSNVPPPMCFQLIWGWTSPCHLRALLCQILGLPPMTMISWKWCKQTHWCCESVSEIGVLQCFR